MSGASQPSSRKTIARSVGEFFGHLRRAIATDPARQAREVRRTVETEARGDVILRRTTIEEIEVRREPTERP
ncbi:MAG: hypothetical protein U0575_11050 [Phycisphaerales bacterium]